MKKVSAEASRNPMFISDVDRRTICEWAIDEIWSNQDDANNALSYLNNHRGLSDDVIKRFKIGYIPKEAGHVLAGRLIMPLYDQHDNLICVTTRDFRKDAKLPHWHESFDKSRFLYGLNLAKRSIFNKNKVLIIEGQFDTHVLHDYSLDISVGALGGVLTYQHVCILRRYCTDFYIWFDPDKAGQRAIQRSLDMYEDNELKWFGINFVPVYIKEDLDPDEYVMKYGKQGVIDLLCESKKQSKGKSYAPTI